MRTPKRPLARTIPPSLLHPVEKNNPNITTLTMILKVREI